MNEEIHCYTKEEKRLRMNGKMMTLTFLELYTAYIKNWYIFFPHLLAKLFTERFTSSVKSYHYF